MDDLKPRQLEAAIQQLLRRQDLAQAERASVRLRDEQPDNPISYWVLAQIDRQRGNYAQALEHLRRCVKLRPQKKSFRVALAKVLRSQGHVGDALSELDEALSVDSNCTATKIEKADLLEHLGCYTESEALIQELLAAGATNASITLIRGNLACHQGDFAAAIEITRPALHNEALDAADRAAQLFVCGQAYDRLDDPRRAIEVLGAANQLIRVPWDRQAFREDVERTLDFFGGGWKAPEVARSTSCLPVIVAAMPRSGSTLLDQIFAAHPRAAGAGELDYFYRFRTRVTQAERLNYPAGIAAMSGDQLSQVAEQYLERLSRACDSRTLRACDKSIENARELGLISGLFPAAKYIHLQRDPLDCCMSVYMHPFYNLAAQTSALGDIGFFYRQHTSCMRKWKEVLGTTILEVDYERVVSDSEPEIRRILAHCDLEWDGACLDYHRSERLVRTLSYHQVSQPIYQSSVGIGEKYRPYVGELLSELGLQ